MRQFREKHKIQANRKSVIFWSKVLLTYVFISDEANGITSDYTYSVGIKYSYTPELRGDGFDPPPEEIQPSFEEVWAGLVAMYNEIEIIEGI